MPSSSGKCSEKDKSSPSPELRRSDRASAQTARGAAYWEGRRQHASSRSGSRVNSRVGSRVNSRVGSRDVTPTPAASSLPAGGSPPAACFRTPSPVSSPDPTGLGLIVWAPPVFENPAYGIGDEVQQPHQTAGEAAAEQAGSRTGEAAEQADEAAEQCEGRQKLCAKRVDVMPPRYKDMQAGPADSQTGKRRNVRNDREERLPKKKKDLVTLAAQATVDGTALGAPAGGVAVRSRKSEVDDLMLFNQGDKGIQEPKQPKRISNPVYTWTQQSSEQCVYSRPSQPGYNPKIITAAGAGKKKPMSNADKAMQSSDKVPVGGPSHDGAGSSGQSREVMNAVPSQPSDAVTAGAGSSGQSRKVRTGTCVSEKTPTHTRDNGPTAAVPSEPSDAVTAGRIKSGMLTVTQALHGLTERVSDFEHNLTERVSDFEHNLTQTLTKFEDVARVFMDVITALNQRIHNEGVANRRIVAGLSSAVASTDVTTFQVLQMQRDVWERVVPPEQRTASSPSNCGENSNDNSAHGRQDNPMLEESDGKQ